jgi:hypothetical protein
LLHITTRVDLGQTDVGQEAVAEAFATDGVLRFALVPHVNLDLVARAAKTQGAVGTFVRRTQVTEVTEAFARGVDVALRERPLESTTLKGNPVGEARGSVKTVTLPAFAAARVWRLRGSARPDSLQNAKAVPTWMPAAPWSRASFNFSGVP